MILGTALIICTWVVFLGLGLSFWAAIVLTVLSCFLILFGLLFLVYFFNLDMKLLAKVQDIMVRYHDKKDKEKKRRI